jgi:hypothetical protein
MTDTEIMKSACSLYDGGWRASDRDEMTAEYDLPDVDADAICKVLQGIEDGEI